MEPRMSRRQRILRALAAAGALLVVPGAAWSADPVPAGSAPTSYRLVASSFMDSRLAYKPRRNSAVRDVDVDKDGNIYLTGRTLPGAFPVTNRINPPKRGPVGRRPDVDIFVMKLDPRGKLLWSVVLGGPNHDRPYALALGRDGAVYVAGRAGPGFPTTEGVVQPRFAGAFRSGLYGKQDGFVAKISPDGRRLLWSTYFGGTGRGFIRDVDVDTQGNVYLAATAVTGEISHITPDAVQKERRGTADAVYAKLSPDGRKVLYATYLGGARDGKQGDGGVPSIRVDRNGNVFFLAHSDAPDFPVTANAFQRHLAGKTDLVITKFDAAGHVLFSTFLGGSDEDSLETHHLALDAAGNPVITCLTRSKDFPVTAGAYQKRYGGGYDIIVARLSADGSRLLAATYLGGSGNDVNEGVAIDPWGRIVLSGQTNADDLPVTPGAYQKRRAGGIEAIVAILDGNLSRLDYASYLGGRQNDSGRAVAVGPDGSIVIGGETGSTDFPIVNGFDSRLDSGTSGFFAKLSP